MCQAGPKWKREVIPDHKFDFVDVRDFHTTTFGVRFRYVMLYVIVLKSFAIYVSDIFTGVTMLTTDKWMNDIYDACPPTEANGCVFIQFSVAKWLFVGCIIFSFILLAYESRKAKKVIASRDISYAFTNVLANNYYSLRSYDHFCLFCKINDSTKTVDNFAFFVFFSFKEWKRLILCDGPRQFINALTLYSFYLAKKDLAGGWDNFSKYSSNMTTTLLLSAMIFTVLIFVGSVLVLAVAALCYVPLLVHIRGNLKEYCCHKTDKRIAELIKKRVKDRQKAELELDRKEAMGDFSHLQNGKRLPQPTLPNVSVDDDDGKSDFKTDYSSSLYKGRSNGSGYEASEYPPMPMYAYDRFDNGSAYEYDAHTRHGTPQPYSQPVQDPYDGMRRGSPRPIQQYENDTGHGHHRGPSAQQLQQQQYGGHGY